MLYYFDNEQEATNYIKKAMKYNVDFSYDDICYMIGDVDEKIVERLVDINLVKGKKVNWDCFTLLYSEIRDNLICFLIAKLENLGSPDEVT